MNVFRSHVRADRARVMEWFVIGAWNGDHDTYGAYWNKLRARINLSGRTAIEHAGNTSGMQPSGSAAYMGAHGVHESRVSYESTIANVQSMQAAGTNASMRFAPPAEHHEGEDRGGHADGNAQHERGGGFTGSSHRGAEGEAEGDTDGAVGVGAHTTGADRTPWTVTTATNQDTSNQHVQRSTATAARERGTCRETVPSRSLRTRRWEQGKIKRRRGKRNREGIVGDPGRGRGDIDEVEGTVRTRPRLGRGRGRGGTGSPRKRRRKRRVGLMVLPFLLCRAVRRRCKGRGAGAHPDGLGYRPGTR